MLDAKQLADYQQQGYLALPSILPPTALASIRDAAIDIVEDFDIDAHRTVFSTTDQQHNRDRYFMESAESVHCFLEQEAIDADGRLLKPKPLAINKIGHAMHDLVPEFREFCSLPVFGDLLRDLGHHRPQLWQSMYIFKQPHIGGEVRWHQDATFLNCGRAQLTGMWIALEDASLENGCLWMQPGGHKTPLREIFRVDPDSAAGNLEQLDESPWPGEDEAVAMPVPAGSVVLFDGFTPHYSSSNRSDFSRHAFTLHFTDLDAPWSPSNWLQRRTLAPFLL